MATAKTTVAQAIVDQLKREGMTTAFGITGSHYLALLEAMERTGIDFYSVKHEACAGFMAAHYARAAQKPALCLGTAGPGILNMVNGIGELYKAQLPALIVSPMVSTREFGKNGFQEDTGLGTTYSINEVLEPLTRLTIRLEAPGDIYRALDELLARMVEPPLGPVHLSVPSDLFDAEIETLEPGARVSTVKAKVARPVEMKKLERAAALIAASERPILTVGLRCVYPDLGAEIAAWSRRFSIPVLSSFSAKGLFDERDPLCLGVLDLFGHRSAEHFIKASDCVISIGHDFSFSNTLKYDPGLIGGKHVQIDSIADDIERVYRTDVAVVGSIPGILETIADELDEQGYTAYTPAQVRDLREQVEALDAQWQKQMDVVANPMKPQRIYRLLERAAHEAECTITADTGMSSWWATRYLSVQAGSFQTFATGHTMGQSAGGVLGAKLARPNRPAICLTGDGAFLMYGNEILTARRYGQGILYVVFVDQRYNMVSMNRKIAYGADSGYATEFDGPDFGLLARAFGIPGCVVSDEASFIWRLEEYLAIVTSEHPQPCLLAVEHDCEELLPTKVQAIGLVEDVLDALNIQDSPYLMKAFASGLRERVHAGQKGS